MIVAYSEFFGERVSSTARRRNLIAAYTSNENTTTKITPVTASTNSDRWKMESAGVELGEKMLGTAGSLARGCHGPLWPVPSRELRQTSELRADNAASRPFLYFSISLPAVLGFSRVVKQERAHFASNILLGPR
jgi:hypothetical protein